MAVDLLSPTEAVALRPYVPETLIEQSARHVSPAWHEWLEGALMHCDITGFTAMSESLQSLGREGAELMAGVLNRFFDTMLGVADTWRGVQMKFGGDAMLLYFAGSDGPARAAACGLEMQRNMPQFRRVKVAGQSYVLRMRIGIHAGRFYSASVGDGDRFQHYLLLGRDVNRTASIEAEAQPGQVVATSAAAAAMGSRVVTMPAAADVWRVRSASLEPPGAHSSGRAPGSGRLHPYVLPALVAALREGAGHGLPSEQRRVTSMFVTLNGTTEMLERAGDDETLRQVNAYTHMLMSAIARHGGVLLGSDVADHGDKFIVLFGAPTLVDEHEASALRCALDLTEGLKASGLDLEQQIGVNTGTVFAGEIGSRARREYTVIGDTVNLAARLMAAARPGETLVSATTTSRIASAFDLRRRKPIRVKGKSAPVRLFALVGGADGHGAHAGAHALPFVGREAEVAALTRPARRAARGAPAWCLVTGDAGIGKTRLVEETVRRLGGWDVVSATARSHAAGTPFSWWVEPLRQLTGVREVPGHDAFATLRAHVTRAAPGQSAFTPVLADMLGVAHPDDELSSSLDAKARRERLTSLVSAIIEARANEGSLAFVLDDAHWSDTSSLELLDAVLARVHAPLLVYVTTRDRTPPAELGRRAADVVLPLNGLPRGDATELIAPLVEDQGLVGRIVARGQGNPLFLIELAQAPPGSEMPETVHDVVLARLDALRRTDREMLRLASVIGPSFEIGSLLALEPSVESYVRDAGARLSAAGFLEVDGDAYAFTHSLTREVAYETLLYADRRRLHLALATHLEGHHEPSSIAETLWHHFRSAREWGRAARYGLISGDRAASLFATAEAVRYYEDALAGLDEAGPNVRIDRSIVFERLGDALDSAGRQRESGDAYFTALSEWLARGSARRPRYIRCDLRARARETMICRKISVSYERRSDYEQALSWIDEALNRLPDGPASVAAEVMASKSVTLFRKGLYAEAIDWGKRAVTLARRGRDRRVLAYAHNMLANSYIEQGALKQAVRQLVPSTRLYHELHDLRGQSAAGNNLASCYQLLGDMDQALYHYQDALQADARLGNVTHAAIIHNNIGEVLLTLGRIHEAEEHLQEVLVTYRVNPGLAALAGLSEVNLSRCALLRGDVPAAEKHVASGIRRLRQVGAQGLLDEAELQLVEVRLAQSRWKPALDRAGAVIERSRASGAKLMEARGERLAGKAKRGLGDLDAAERHLRDSASLARKSAGRIEELHALGELADLLVESGRSRDAEPIITRGEALARAVGDERRLAALTALREPTATRGAVEPSTIR